MAFVTPLNASLVCLLWYLVWATNAASSKRTVLQRSSTSTFFRSPQCSSARNRRPILHVPRTPEGGLEVFLSIFITWFLRSLRERQRNNESIAMRYVVEAAPDVWDPFDTRFAFVLSVSEGMSSEWPRKLWFSRPVGNNTRARSVLFRNSALRKNRGKLRGFADFLLFLLSFWSL